MTTTEPDRSRDHEDDEHLDPVRRLVVEAGLEVLERDGLGLSPQSITYARVFAYLQEEHGIKVTRSSVHDRIWASQEAFRLDVLTMAANHTARYESSAGMHDAVVAVLSALDRLGLTRRQRLFSFCRIAGHALLQSYLESDRFRRFQAIKAAARPDDDPAATEVLRSLVQEKADGNQDERAMRFAFMFDALGLRPRPELGLSNDDAVDLFMTLAQILLAGSHLDHHAGFVAMASKTETDLPVDEDFPWTPFGFAFLACADLLFEDDPAAEVPPAAGYPAAEQVAPLHRAAAGPPDLAALATDRPRRTKAELKELVLAAAVHLFLRDGLRLQVESLTYAKVFTHIKETKGIQVHRSTVHGKIWSSQDEFRAEVLGEAARFGTDESRTAMRQAMAAQTVTRNPDRSINVRQLILDNTRATMAAQLSTSATSPTFHRWQSIKATMLSADRDPMADSLRMAINDHYEDMLSVFSEIYQSVLPLVGLEVNPELRMSDEQAYHLLATICATLACGADFNIAAGATLATRTISLPRADGSGQCDEWPLPAIGSLATLDLLFTPHATA